MISHFLPLLETLSLSEKQNYIEVFLVLETLSLNEKTFLPVLETLILSEKIQAFQEECAEKCLKT